MSKPMFEVVFIVNADKMAELIVDHGMFMKSVEVLDGSDGPQPQKRTRAASTHIRSLGGNIWPAANGPKTKGRAQLLALQVAQKLCAGKAKGVERTVFREAVIKAFTDSGVLSASSASPTISDMIKAGVIVYELRA